MIFRHTPSHELMNKETKLQQSSSKYLVWNKMQEHSMLNTPMYTRILSNLLDRTCRMPTK